MIKNTVLRAGFAVIIFVIGNLQAWDSDVPKAGLLIVLLVSLAIALPPVALLVPLSQQHFLGAFALSFILLILARLISPIPLPGLFIVLVPAVSFVLLLVARLISPIPLPGLFLVLIPGVMGLIFTGIFSQEAA